MTRKSPDRLLYPRWTGRLHPCYHNNMPKQNLKKDNTDDHTSVEVANLMEVTIAIVVDS